MELTYENRSSDFHCRDTRTSSAPLETSTHLHYHVEMGCLFRGNTKLVIDSKEYLAEPEDTFICFPNQVHNFHTLSKEEYILFIFNPDIVPEFSRLFAKNLPKSNLLKGALRDKEIFSLMYNISNAASEGGAYSQMIIRGYLLVLLSKLFGMMELYNVQSSDTKLLGTILNYCIKNYDQPLSLSILEKELHISKFYISHTLSNKLHIGFNDYINSLRVSNACRYLLGSDMSITEISEKVGFNTLRTFNRAFVKHMKVTPSQYRTQKAGFGFTSMPI